MSYHSAGEVKLLEVELKEYYLDVAPERRFQEEALQPSRTGLTGWFDGWGSTAGCAACTAIYYSYFAVRKTTIVI